MEKELKPCPFCGFGAASFELETGWHAGCKACSASIIGFTEENAVNKWNNRQKDGRVNSPGFRFIFDIEANGEPGAGIVGFTDRITIDVDSFFPGGEPGEFEHYIKDALSEWYDGAKVCFNGEDND